MTEYYAYNSVPCDKSVKELINSQLYLEKWIKMDLRYPDTDQITIYTDLEIF